MDDNVLPLVESQLAQGAIFDENIRVQIPAISAAQPQQPQASEIADEHFLLARQPPYNDDIECDTNMFVDVASSSNGSESTLQMAALFDESDVERTQYSPLKRSWNAARPGPKPVGVKNRASSFDTGALEGKDFPDWAHDHVAKIARHPHLQAELDAKLEKYKFELYSAYSGSGGAEQIVREVREALQFVTPSAPDFMTCVQCCDNNDICKKVLQMIPEGPERPQHGFGDINDLVTAEELSSLRRIVGDYAEVLEGLKTNKFGDMPSDPVIRKLTIREHQRRLGLDLLDALINVAKDIDFHGRQAFCFMHNRMCAACPGDADARTVRLFIAGHSCKAWSVFGNQDGWVSDDAVTFVIYLYSMLAARPDFFIGECTLKFDHDVYAKIYKSHGYKFFTAVEGQIDSGFPGSRIRKIFILMDERKWKTNMEPDSRAFKEFFSRKVATFGDAYFQAPEDLRKLL
jgi:hypothetical protein